MLRAHQTWRPLLVAMALFVAISLTARQEKPSNQEKSSKTAKATAATDLPAVLWRDPGDISSLDLIEGPGGKEHAPRENDEYKFIREDLNGTSTKFYVEDSEKVRWLVKVAEEA